MNKLEGSCMFWRGIDVVAVSDNNNGTTELMFEKCETICSYDQETIVEK